MILVYLLFVWVEIVSSLCFALDATVNQQIIQLFLKICVCLEVDRQTPVCESFYILDTAFSIPCSVLIAMLGIMVFGLLLSFSEVVF